MPRVYERKQNISPRGQWTEENLAEAARRYTAGEIGLREAERVYGVPTRTLTRRMHQENRLNAVLALKVFWAMQMKSDC